LIQDIGIAFLLLAWAIRASSMVLSSGVGCHVASLLARTGDGYAIAMIKKSL
jgi:hypothetical protein